MTSSILTPLGWLYEKVMAVRNLAYDCGVLKEHSSVLPVISIGNITVGGNAKTPLVMWLVKALRERGHQPVVLTRGYGGRLKGPHVITASCTPDAVGDEPLMIHTRLQVPVVKAVDRVAGVRLIEEQFPESVVLLDDGLQHRRLSRDLNVVSVNVSTVKDVQLFLKGQVLPAGRFRENCEGALTRTNAVVLAYRQPRNAVDAELEEAIEGLSKWFPDSMPLLKSYVEPEGVWSCSGSESLDPCPVVACCAIANPHGFFSTLESLGFEILHREVLADHGVIDDALLERMKSQFPYVPVVYTEKDAIKRDSPTELEWQLRVGYELETGEELLHLIEKAAKQKP